MVHGGVDDVVDTVAVVVFGMMFAASPMLSRDCFGGLPMTGVPLREPSAVEDFLLELVFLWFNRFLLELSELKISLLRVRFS